MKTLPELQVAFSNVNPEVEGELINTALRFFAVEMPEGEDPYTELSNYATADFQVANLGDGFYAACPSDFTGCVVEITE